VTLLKEYYPRLFSSRKVVKGDWWLHTPPTGAEILQKKGKADTDTRQLRRMADVLGIELLSAPCGRPSKKNPVNKK
jgi:hypothetical protein